MKVSNLKMDPYEIEQRKMEKQAYQFETSLSYLQCHKGMRKCNIHLYMGTSGSGKSTSLRTLICDIIKNNPLVKIKLWLSEETIDDIKDEISKITDPEVVPLLHNVIVTSEMEGMNRGSLLELKENFRAFVMDGNEDGIVLFDNITTSALYEGLSPSQQASQQGWFKELCIASQKPFFFYAHTDAKVYDNMPRLINQNDIRGNKGITNIAQYLYISQRFEIANLYYPTLRIVKYRGYSVEDRLFYMDYNKETSTFHKDWVLPWKDFHQAFSVRNQLK